ncbi:ABC transporter ATP-binding protein [Paenibacillus chitinolyticus]|uniref:ABC transporter ATP-binding protein n=1 Tax=Paenibacillus chitinolyticus TaxID=79263 RepID=UPI00366B6320
MKMIKRFVTYYKPYKKVLIADLIFAALASMCALAFPMLVHFMTTSAISEEGIAAVLFVKMIAVFLFLMAVEYGSGFYTDYYGHAMGAAMEADMRNDLFRHVQSLPFSFHDKTATGQLMSRATHDLFNISELAHHGPEDLVISFVRIAGSAIILWQLNPVLALTLLSVLPFMFLFAYRYSIKVKEALKKNNERIGDLNAQLEDSLAGVRVVQSFANEEVETAKFRAGNEVFLGSRKKGYKAEALFFNGLTSFMSLMYIAVVVAGAFLISNNMLLLTELITFLLYINTITDPVKRLVNFTQNLQNGAAGFERFVEILSIKPAIADSEDAVTLNRVRGKIRFENVGFRYSGDNSPVFSHLNLTVSPGETVALVGSSGAGKTTLCQLIPRFYDPSEGNVYVDDLNIKDVELKSLRSQIGIVQQDVYLFAGTVRDNIRYGKPDATDEEIIAAAKLAHAHEFITGLPGAYEAFVGQRGNKLSGGQKQRISIARVILRNPAILIFDEATSALDNESERIIQRSMEMLARNRTALIIAHRLSTIRDADRIVVLTEQGFAEEGTHETLMRQGGTYAKLYNMQSN